MLSRMWTVNKQFLVFNELHCLYVGETHMLYRQQKQEQMLTGSFGNMAFTYFCLLSSINFSDVSLPFTSMGFGDEYSGTEAGSLR